MAGKEVIPAEEMVGKSKPAPGFATGWPSLSSTPELTFLPSPVWRKLSGAATCISKLELTWPLSTASEAGRT